MTIRTRRLGIALGLALAGVLSVPAVAGADTGHDEHSAAPTTTVTTAAPATTTTTKAATTTTTAAPTGPIKTVTLKPGGTFSLSGKGCLYNEKPGMVSVGLVKLDAEGDAVGPEYDYPDLTPAADGSWSFAGKLPPIVTDGAWGAIGVCRDPADPNNSKTWKAGPDNAVLIVIEGSAPPKRGDEKELATSVGHGKTKPVKTNPAFTG